LGGGVPTSNGGGKEGMGKGKEGVGRGKCREARGEDGKGGMERERREGSPCMRSHK